MRRQFSAHQVLLHGLGQALAGVESEDPHVRVIEVVATAFGALGTAHHHRVILGVEGKHRVAAAVGQSGHHVGQLELPQRLGGLDRVDIGMQPDQAVLEQGRAARLGIGRGQEQLLHQAVDPRLAAPGQGDGHGPDQRVAAASGAVPHQRQVEVLGRQLAEDTAGAPEVFTEGRGLAQHFVDVFGLAGLTDAGTQGATLPRRELAVEKQALHLQGRLLVVQPGDLDLAKIPHAVTECRAPGPALIGLGNGVALAHAGAALIAPALDRRVVGAHHRSTALLGLDLLPEPGLFHRSGLTQHRFVLRPVEILREVELLDLLVDQALVAGPAPLLLELITLVAELFDVGADLGLDRIAQPVPGGNGRMLGRKVAAAVDAIGHPFSGHAELGRHLLQVLVHLFAVFGELGPVAFLHLAVGGLDGKRLCTLAQLRPDHLPFALVLLALEHQLPLAVDDLHVRRSQALGGAGHLVVLVVDRHHHVVVQQRTVDPTVVIDPIGIGVQAGHHQRAARQGAGKEEAARARLLGNVHIGRRGVRLVRPVVAEEIRRHAVRAPAHGVGAVLGVFELIQPGRDFHQLHVALGRQAPRLDQGLGTEGVGLGELHRVGGKLVNVGAALARFEAGSERCQPGLELPVLGGLPQQRGQRPQVGEARWMELLARRQALIDDGQDPGHHGVVQLPMQSLPAPLGTVAVEGLQQILADAVRPLGFITGGDIQGFEERVVAVADHEGRVGHLELPVLLDARRATEQLRQGIADGLGSPGNAPHERGVQVAHVACGFIVRIGAELAVAAVLVVLDQQRGIGPGLLRVGIEDQVGVGLVQPVVDHDLVGAGFWRQRGMGIDRHRGLGKTVGHGAQGMEQRLLAQAAALVAGQQRLDRRPQRDVGRRQAPGAAQQQVQQLAVQAALHRHLIEDMHLRVAWMLPGVGAGHSLCFHLDRLGTPLFIQRCQQQFGLGNVALQITALQDLAQCLVLHQVLPQAEQQPIVVVALPDRRGEGLFPQHLVQVVALDIPQARSTVLRQQHPGRGDVVAFEQARQLLHEGGALAAAFKQPAGLEALTAQLFQALEKRRVVLIQGLGLGLAQVAAADLVALDGHQGKRRRRTVSVTLGHFQQVLMLGKADRALQLMNIDEQAVAVRVVAVLPIVFDAQCLEAGDVRVLVDQFAQGAGQGHFAGHAGAGRLARDLDADLVGHFAIDTGQQQLAAVAQHLGLEAFAQGAFRHQVVGEVLLDEPGLDQHRANRCIGRRAHGRWLALEPVLLLPGQGTGGGAKGEIQHAVGGHHQPAVLQVEVLEAAIGAGIDQRHVHADVARALLHHQQ